MMVEREWVEKLEKKVEVLKEHVDLHYALLTKVVNRLIVLEQQNERGAFRKGPGHSSTLP